MRVLVVSHYFPPELGAPQARLSELAQLWADAGDEVTVLTGMPNHPTGIIPTEYRGKLRVEERVDGYRVVRTWLYATPNEGIVKKTLGHLAFMFSAVLLGARRAGPADVVVVSSPTFFSIFSARVLARLRRAKLVVEIRDLWPAAMVELGVLTNRTLVGVLERLELANYRAADAVVVVTEGFRQDLIGRGVPAAKVHTVRNGADVERFARPPAGAAVADMRRRLNAPEDGVLVLYLGAHGISHSLGTVVDAAVKLAGEGDHVHVALVGEGAEKAAIAARVASAGVPNVSMHAAVPRDEVPTVLAAADICLVPLRDVPLFGTFIPSKMFEFLAAGKAVIGAVRGEAAEILEKAGAVVVPPEDPGALAGAVVELAADPARRAAMGRQGQEYVAAHFDRRRLAERYRQVLSGLPR